MHISALDDPDSPNGKPLVTPSSRSLWRRWLSENHHRPDGVWVVYRKNSSDLVGPTYDDLVEEALCFGWIDSQTRRVDDDRLLQWFSPRRSGGMWSKSNKERVERLAAAGLMTPPGQAAIDAAKADGMWAISDEIESLELPSDLAAALGGPAQAAWDGLSNSWKRQQLWWILTARRPETRATRIATVAEQIRATKP